MALDIGRGSLMTKSLLIIINGAPCTGKTVMLQMKLDFCGSLISYKLGSDKGGVHVEEA